MWLPKVYFHHDGLKRDQQDQVKKIMTAKRDLKKLNVVGGDVSSLTQVFGLLIIQEIKTSRQV